MEGKTRVSYFEVSADDAAVQRYRFILEYAIRSSADTYVASEKNFTQFLSQKYYVKKLLEQMGLFNILRKILK